MKEITYYDFNLDLFPENRWKFIFDANENIIPKLKIHLENLIASFGNVISLALTVYSVFPKSSIMYHDEICYIASRLNIEPYKITILQLAYEMTSACTSAIVNVADKEFFIRTMDWPMSFLKDVTIGLNVTKNNVLLAKVTTWIGYVGFLTATNKTDNYTLAINFRRTDEFTLTQAFCNLYKTIMLKWPVGHLIRHIITCNMSLIDAIDLLTTAQLICPTYITVFAPKRKSCIITRDSDKLVNIRIHDLVQTNCDFDKTYTNILYSIERIAHVNKIQLELKDNSGITCKEIFKKLFDFPVANEETIYVHFQYENNFKTFVTN